MSQVDGVIDSTSGSADKIGTDIVNLICKPVSDFVLSGFNATLLTTGTA